MNENNKKKFPLWIHPDILKQVRNLYEDCNCKSQSEFIENAIIFYCGYISSEENEKYLPNIITSTMKGIVSESENKISRMLFKLSVELAMTMNIIAALNDIDEHDLIRLRGMCIDDVKSLNGSIKLDDAIKFQRGR